jgi:hypothetical protein
MSQAIVTKYLPPTNHRGARMKATTDSGSTVVPYRHELSIVENHRLAAQTHGRSSKLSWTGEMVGGSIEKGARYVFVFTS